MGEKKMRGKKPQNESDKLEKVYLDALKINNSKKIAEMESKKLELRKQHEEKRYLGHAWEAMLIKNEIDSINGQIINLNSQKQNAASDALLKLRKFNQPYVKGYNERLRRVFENLERAKFKEVVSAGDTLFAGKVIKVNSNILSVMEAQLKVSKANDLMSDEVSLSKTAKIVEDIEKNVPTEFKTQVITLHEREDISVFYTPEDVIDNSDFTLQILPSRVLTEKIKNFEELSTRKMMAAA